ncbi:MAG: exodeoxyribonuclease large subunit [Clostridiales bacterium]|nr:exodeoxyribonuclease large subunit [Clostridiales bacterium]
MKDAVYSVSQVNGYIKNLFARESILQQIYVKGEVSNCKYHTSGHIYFTLKDEKGQMACVMFAGQRNGLSFRMSEGQSVIVLGSIQVYERDGKYQMYAKEILLDGQGALYEQYERQKQKLKELGLFDETYKRPIPKYATRIGVVTASTGAAIQDIINITHRRNPYAQLFLYPAKVQGDGAKDTIVAGIEYLDQFGVDVIIVGRGGGSIEDLWAFNEEAVAWAIFNCNTPIISAVGHETDTTIADYVADLRAPTPSAGAELAVFSVLDFFYELETKSDRLNRTMKQRIDALRSRLSNYQLRITYQDPMHQLVQRRQFLADAELRMQDKMERKVNQKRHQLALYIERLNGLSPLNRLSQGYSYVTDEMGNVIKSVHGQKPGDVISVDMVDGTIKATIDVVKPRKRKG